jgi:hypothetical protein
MELDLTPRQAAGWLLLIVVIVLVALAGLSSISHLDLRWS